MSTWPTGSDIATTNLDDTADDPSQARADLKLLADMVNDMKNAADQNSGIPTLDSSGKLKDAQFATTSRKVIVSANDTTPDELDAKLVAGSNITLSVQNDGGNETLTIAAATQIPTGTVLPYTGTSAPSGFVFAYGQSLDTTTYAGLFAVTGYTYGGSGASFNTPDLRGRVVAGKDDMGGVSANRLTDPATTVGGIDGDVLGGTGGEEDHTQTEAQLVGHTHSWGNGATNRGTGAVVVPQTGGASYATTSTGDGDPFNVVQPTIILNYIIKT